MRAVFSKILSGTAWSTSPMRLARFASTVFPVRSKSIAAAGPTSCGSHCMACQAGITPTITSGCAKRGPGGPAMTELTDIRKC